MCLRWRCGRISVELLVERWQKEDEIAEVREPVKSFFLLFLLMCIPTGSVLRLSGVRATNDLPAWSIEWEPGRIDRRLAHLCSFAQYATLPALSANSIEVFDSNKSHTHTHTHTHTQHAPTRALPLAHFLSLTSKTSVVGRGATVVSWWLVRSARHLPLRESAPMQG